MKKVYIILCHGLRGGQPTLTYYRKEDRSFTKNPKVCTKYHIKFDAMDTLENLDLTENSFYKVEQVLVNKLSDIHG